MADYQTDASAWYPQPDKEQAEQVQAEERDEIQHLQSSVGVIEDVLKWFDTKIAYYASIASVNFTEDTPDAIIKVKLLLNQELREAYTTQKQEFIDAFSTFMTEG